MKEPLQPRAPLTESREHTAEETFIAVFAPLVEAYKKIKKSETDGNEVAIALDEMVEAAALAYRKAGVYTVIRHTISSAIRSVLKEVLGDEYDAPKMTRLTAQLFYKIAEFGTGDCGAETAEAARMQFGVELAEILLNQEPAVQNFRSGMDTGIKNLVAAVRSGNIRAEDSQIVCGKEEHFDPAAKEAVRLMQNAFDQLVSDGRFSDTTVRVLNYEIEHVCRSEDESINAVLALYRDSILETFRAYVDANKERLLEEQRRRWEEIRQPASSL